MLSNRHTETHTHRQTHRPSTCNPRCACAPRVNYHRPWTNTLTYMYEESSFTQHKYSPGNLEGTKQQRREPFRRFGCYVTELHASFTAKPCKPRLHRVFIPTIARPPKDSPRCPTLGEAVELHPTDLCLKRSECLHPPSHR